MNRQDRMCLCKRRYADEAEAAAWIATKPDRHGFELRPYRCPFCHLVHITKQRLPAAQESIEAAV